MMLLVHAIAALLGMPVYVLSSNPKAAELGRIAFSCGLLVGLLVFAHSGIKILP